jgi:hypothetical protein
VRGWRPAPAPQQTPTSRKHFIQPSLLHTKTIHLIENCIYLHNLLIGPINYNNNGTAAADGQQQQQHQRPTARTYTYFPFHSSQPNQPNPCFVPSVQILRCSSTSLKLETRRPYGRVKSSNRIAAAARPRRPAPTCPARWWDLR